MVSQFPILINQKQLFLNNIENMLNHDVFTWVVAGCGKEYEVCRSLNGTIKSLEFVGDNEGNFVESCLSGYVYV